MPATSAPACSTSLTAAAIVPPVASRSSTMSTRWPPARGVGVYFERVLPVLQGVGHSGGPVGQPSLFAGRYQCGPKAVGDWSGEEKPARLYAEHHIDIAAAEAVRESVNGVFEGLRRGEQRGDIPEEYSFDREVWNVSDVAFQVQLTFLLNGRTLVRYGRTRAQAGWS